MPNNFLRDLIPTKYRRTVYGLAALALYLWGVWEAVQGDWRQFAVRVGGALIAQLAYANTNEPDPDN